MDKDMATDIIAEVINIGIGEAAASLSDLVHSRVVIQAPDIYILEAKKSPDFIKEEIKALGVYISQDFYGGLRGKTLLFYTRESCISLLKALLGDVVVTTALTDSAIATLQEIGNILMVSCVSTISNMVEDLISFDIPDVTVEISEGYFQNLVRGMDELDKVIVIKNEMSVKEKKIEGYIFVLLGIRDFEAVIEKLSEKLQNR